ncbi:hypothetical protein NDU88_000944, partial [Pleurodeles waltl]
VKIRNAEAAVVRDESMLTTLNSLRAAHNEADTRLGKHDYRHYITRQHAEGDRSGRLLAWLTRQPS